MKRPGQISLLVALLIGLGGWLAVAGHTHLAAAPVRAEDAGLTGDVWVMPEKAVVGFLENRGVHQANADPYPSGTAVVGRVSWSPLKGDEQDRFTVLLGDASGGAGVIDTVVGLPDGAVSLGSGSMWDRTTKAHAWLRGSRPTQVGGGSTDYATFASIPTDWAGDVWFVAHVVDVAASQDAPVLVDDPRPVVGVALSTEDRVWWTRKVAAA